MIARAQTRRWATAAALLCAANLSITTLAAAATVTIVNLDGVGEGFNDPTPAAPVGGNPGTTIGAQRLFVFQHAASIWGGALPSNIEIRVNAQFSPQTCDATSGVLGSAGPTFNMRDFAGAPFANTWYHVALANKLANADLQPASADINTTFNSSIGGTGCLPSGWYYGIDGNEGGQIELLPVVLHELGHGLGFSTSTSGLSGTMLSGFPHVYDRFLYDNATGLHWNQMSSAQRVASAIQCKNLVWSGPMATSAAPFNLGARPVLTVHSPASIDGNYDVGVASFGPALDATGVTGNVVLANDGVGNPSNACEPFVNAGAVSGNIALVRRGGCPFSTKVLNAQNAGAVAVIVADSVAGCAPAGLGGTGPSIVIPSVRVTQADGNLIEANLGSGVNVTMNVNAALLAGADDAGRVRIYTPNPFQSGSSVSHWDTSAEPSLLMEPAITSGLSSDIDLTRAHFGDIGWYLPLVDVGNTPVAAHRLFGSAPNPTSRTATITFTLATEDLADVTIYDLGGRLVNRIVNGRLPAGTHAAKWNGLDLAGRPVPAGVYVYRLRTPSFSTSRHLAVVK